ncbi:MAG: hypothetical protein WD607_07860 [Candidatus Paceibacterota bacterium]
MKDQKVIDIYSAAMSIWLILSLVFTVFFFIAFKGDLLPENSILEFMFILLFTCFFTILIVSSIKYISMGIFLMIINRKYKFLFSIEGRDFEKSVKEIGKEMDAPEIKLAVRLFRDEAWLYC